MLPGSAFTEVPTQLSLDLSPLLVGQEKAEVASRPAKSVHNIWEKTPNWEVRYMQLLAYMRIDRSGLAGGLFIERGTVGGEREVS